MKILTRLLVKLSSFYLILLGLFLSILVGWWAWQIQRNDRNDKYSNDFENRVTLFKSEMARSLDALNDISATINVHGEPTRSQFNEFVNNSKLADRYYGLYAISYSPIIKREDVPSYIEKVKADKSIEINGYPEFHMIGPPVEFVKHQGKLDIHPLVALQSFVEPKALVKKNGMMTTFGRDMLAVYPNANYNSIMEKRTDKIFSTSRPVPIVNQPWADIFTLRRFVYGKNADAKSPIGIVLFALSISQLMRPFSNNDESIARLWYVGNVSGSPLPMSDLKPKFWFDTSWELGKKTTPDKPGSFAKAKTITFDGVDFLIQGVYTPKTTVRDFFIPAMAGMLVFSVFLIIHLALRSQIRARQEAIQLGGHLDTERKLADEMRGMLAHMARLNLSREMAGSLSHELRQPLAVIRSYCSAGWQSLRNMNIKDELLEEVLEGCDSAAKRATTLVENWRDFVVSKRQQVTFPLETALKDATTLVEPRCRSLHTKLVWQGQWDCNIHGDPIMIGQVWINLIQNSLDAIEMRSIQSGLINLSCSVNGNRISLQVSDNGGGINPEIQKSIFEPFVTDKPNGTGLGLAICRSIIRNMGGEVMLTTNDDGAIATLDLPKA